MLRWLSEQEMVLVTSKGAFWQAFVLDEQSDSGLPALLAMLQGAQTDADGRALGYRLRGSSGELLLDEPVWLWRRDGADVVLSRPGEDDVRLPLEPRE